MGGGVRQGGRGVSIGGLIRVGGVGGGWRKGTEGGCLCGGGGF